jgi:hypothetical protein
MVSFEDKSVNGGQEGELSRASGRCGRKAVMMVTIAYMVEVSSAPGLAAMAGVLTVAQAKAGPDGLRPHENMPGLAVAARER